MVHMTVSLFVYQGEGYAPMVELIGHILAVIDVGEQVIAC